jgi:DNA-directed RNA polymerase subunit RPC12/RpoP
MSSKKNRESKTIAEIKIDISPEVQRAFGIADTFIEPATDTPTTRELFLDDHNNCPLCGSELLYTHVTQFTDLNVAEEAHCEPCNVRVKQNNHTLQ